MKAEEFEKIWIAARLPLAELQVTGKRAVSLQTARS
jgi:hypothetical protein